MEKWEVVSALLSSSMGHEMNLIEFGTLGRLRDNAIDLCLFS